MSSSQAILDAAERVFADRGYDGASMQEIATAAGVSRGLPGYAFGSKRALYAAVLERVFARPRSLAAALTAAMDGAGADQALRVAVEGYIDFLVEHPTYVRLLHRAALDDGDLLAAVPDAAGAVTDAFGAALGVVGDTAFRSVDPRHLVVSVIALCFFPLAHERTLLAPLGLGASGQDFLRERKAHVVDLLLHGLRAPPRQP